MIEKKSKAGRLVCQHLEGISSEIFEGYPKIIYAFVKGKQGLYALYKGDKLYYVGLASDLKRRLNHHLKDRHAGRWNKFSIFLTKGIKHLKEMETLVLRISLPKGNCTRGKYVQSENLERKLSKEIDDHHRLEKERLLGGRTKIRRVKSQKKKLQVALVPYVNKGFTIRLSCKGETYVAKVLTSGKIKYNGELYNSPSGAGKAIRKRATNGWRWWKYQKSQGNWVPIDDLRKGK